MSEIQRYAELKREIAALEDRVKSLKAEAAAIEAGIIDDWIQQEVTQTKIGGMTVYMRRQTFAAMSDPMAARDILRSIGMDDFNQPQSTRLSAWMREELEKGHDLPAEFGETIIATTRHSLAVRGLRER